MVKNKIKSEKDGRITIQGEPHYYKQVLPPELKTRRMRAYIEKLAANRYVTCHLCEKTIDRASGIPYTLNDDGAYYHGFCLMKEDMKKTSILDIFNMGVATLLDGLNDDKGENEK